MRFFDFPFSSLQAFIRLSLPFGGSRLKMALVIFKIKILNPFLVGGGRDFELLTPIEEMPKGISSIPP